MRLFLLGCLATLLFSERTFGQASAPPSKITVTIANVIDNRFNGTFDLYPTQAGVYQWKPNPQSGTAITCTVKPGYTVEVVAAAGQFPQAIWRVIGDVYTVGAAPPLGGSWTTPTQVQIVATP